MHRSRSSITTPFTSARTRLFEAAPSCVASVPPPTGLAKPYLSRKTGDAFKPIPICRLPVFLACGRSATAPSCPTPMMARHRPPPHSSPIGKPGNSLATSLPVRTVSRLKRFLFGPRVNSPRSDTTKRWWSCSDYVFPGSLRGCSGVGSIYSKYRHSPAKYDCSSSGIGPCFFRRT